MSPEKINELNALIESMQAQLTRAKLLLNDIESGQPAPQSTYPLHPSQDPPFFGADTVDASSSNANIVEGLFDGQHMVGPDGKQYNIPANYASKSKLVEGDVMKLTITGDGSFIYKQIGPVQRKRVTGKLQRDGTGFVMQTDQGNYKLLLASVTYYKGQVGDAVVAFVPTHGRSAWAAVEHIIPQDQVTPELMSSMMEEDEVEVDDVPELHQGDEGLLPSGEEGLLPEHTLPE